MLDVDLGLLEGDGENVVFAGEDSVCGLLTFSSVIFAEDLGRLGDGGAVYLL